MSLFGVYVQVLFFGPAQIAGVSFGLVINRCLAAWLIMVLLLVVLSYSAFKCIKQYKRIVRERKRDRQTAGAGEQETAGDKALVALGLPSDPAAAPAAATTDSIHQQQFGKGKLLCCISSSVSSLFSCLHLSLPLVAPAAPAAAAATMAAVACGALFVSRRLLC